MPDKRILILMTNPFASLNWIHSGLMTALNKTHTIYIMSDFISEHDLSALNEHFGMQVRLVNVAFPKDSAWYHAIRRVEKLLFVLINDIKTFQIKLRNRGYLHIYLFLFLQKCFPFWLASFMIGGLRNFLINIRLHESDLTGFNQVDAVISTSPFDFRENQIVNSLKKKQIKSMASIISWDNLTTKGLINADHDYVLVWNELMRREFEVLYKAFGSLPKICVTGIPRLDKLLSKVENQQNQPKSNIILFATSPSRHVRNQEQFVADLLEYAGFNRTVSIVIRCHPADTVDYLAHFQPSQLLHVWRPFVRNEHSPILPFTFLETYYKQLAQCSVCVHIASTARIDAAAAKKPLINIAYDPEPRPPRQSIARLYDYSHQLPANKLGVGVMVYSKKELFSALDQALSGQCNRQYDGLDLLINSRKSEAITSTIKYISEWLH